MKYLSIDISFYYEDWEFVDCIYYAFITLSTIGFGDLVAGKCCWTVFVCCTLYSVQYLLVVHCKVFNLHNVNCTVFTYFILCTCCTLYSII